MSLLSLAKRAAKNGLNRVLPMLPRLYLTAVELPPQRDHLDTICAAAGRLAHKVAALDVSNLDISPYSRDFFRQHQARFFMSMRHYGMILSWLAAAAPQPLGRCRFLDYGGGTGVLSLLASEAGFGEVYYNDIYDVSCHDARIISEAIGLPRAAHLCGDLPDVLSHCRKAGLTFDLIGSFDAIEHVYDIHRFIATIPELLTPNGAMFLCSGANAHNVWRRAHYEKGHHRVENDDRVNTEEHKKRDSLTSYRNLRRTIIREKAQRSGASLTEAQIETLTTATRGLIKADIESAIDRFLATGVLPQPDTRFPTNTCDPLTGNWAEHLMDFEALLRTVPAGRFAAARIVPRRRWWRYSDHLAIFAHGAGTGQG